MEMRRFDSSYVLKIRFAGLHVGEEKIGRMKPGVPTWQLHPFCCLLTESAKVRRAGLMGCWKIMKAFPNTLSLTASGKQQ